MDYQCPFPLIRMPAGTKAWHICRTLELVEVMYTSEDGRVCVIKTDGAGERTVESDSVFMTNREALETLELLAEYWEGKRRAVAGLLSANGPESIHVNRSI